MDAFPGKKPLLSKRNASKRLAFARTDKNSFINFWKKVLWSVEPKINRIGSDGRTFVRRPRCPKYNPCQLSGNSYKIITPNTRQTCKKLVLFGTD